MGEAVIIYGKSGTGKSRSLMNFGEDEILLVNTVNKRLPFPKKFKYEYKTDDVAKVKKALSKMVENNIKTAVIDTGVHVAIPEGMVGLITSKSGLMAKGITCRGTIDSGYTGSIHAVLYNHGQEAVAFNAGDKICQLVVLPCVIDPIEVVDDLEETERGDAGFGSTGR